MTQALEIFRKELDSNRDALAEVLPQHLPVGRLNRTVISCIKADPELLNCARNSLWKAVMSAAVFGLEIDGRQAAIIRYGRHAQLLPMVSGLITLAYNAGIVIDAQVVREADEFSYELGLDPWIKHRPASGQGRGNDNHITHSYAISWPMGHRADRVFDVLDLPDIINRRDRSSGWKAFNAGKIKSTPWATDFAAMSRKSAVRARANHLPWQVQKADELEGRADRGENTWAEKMPDGSINIEGQTVDEKDGSESNA